MAAFSLQKKKTSPLVGIELSSTAVKVVQIGRHGDRYKVEHFAIEPLQVGAVTEEGIADTESVGKTIEHALKRAGIRSKSAAVAVRGGGTIAKTITVAGDLKQMSEDDIQSQVDLEAPNHIPFPIEDVRLDFVVIGPSKTEGLIEVRIAAARNDRVSQIQEAAEIAGLTVEVMDLELLAIETAYAEVTKQLRLDENEIVALVDIGATHITLNVMRGGQSIYQRSQPFDARQLEKELVRQYALSQDEALIALQGHSYPEGFEAKNIEPYREGLSQNISRLLQYFYSGGEYNSIGKMLLIGGGANVRGLTETLEERLGVQVHIANPLSSMSLGSGVKGQELAAQASSLFLATGLGLRGFEPGVNLMPWREKRRKERHQAVMRMLGLSAASALAVVLALWTIQSGMVESQESRNRQLQSEIDVMDKRVEQIQDLDVKRERLLGRKQVIDELQSGRSQMVHLFDQLVRTVPDGIQLNGIQQAGGFLIIEGRSESNSRVSDYLRRLDASAWLDKPDLQIIEEEGSGARNRSGSSAGSDSLPYLFRIQVTLVNPNQPNEDGEVVEQSAPTEDPEAMDGSGSDEGAVTETDPASMGSEPPVGVGALGLPGAEEGETIPVDPMEIEPGSPIQAPPSEGSEPEQPLPSAPANPSSLPPSAGSTAPTES